VVIFYPVVLMRYTKVVENNRVKLGLQGPLDDTADFSSLKLDTVAALDVDFEHVDICNSRGILEWVRFLQTLPSNIKVTLLKCSPVIVNQLNIFPALLLTKPIQVASVFVPLSCTCGKTIVHLLNLGPTTTVHSLENIQLPSVPCACGGSFAFSGAIDSYFGFLETLQQ